ncbi:phage baseplate assembly protein V [Vibrio spartinae]|uniref:Bacteriophage Mu Gp45 protein n=1 Tax=Vibrio spartinae TaxID=1918945 RepID=A0A1N6M5T2_9VIBR|nr:phage baseplate assembly protein V [Vibrio spartinae]SIO94784.1 Bacteriophage Mu Gp45 protein [Vibrio spartinae]
MEKTIVKLLKRMIQTMFTRTIQSAVDDALARQTMQVQALNGEVFSDVERWQQYGHTSVPPTGSEQLVLALGGNRSNLAIICAEDKAVRLKGLIDGDSALYHQEGHYLKLTKGGVFELDGDTLNITVNTINIIASDGIKIEAPVTTIQGDVILDGNLSTSGNIAAQGVVTGEQGGTFAGVSSGDHTHDYDDDGKRKSTEKPNGSAQ